MANSIPSNNKLTTILQAYEKQRQLYADFALAIKGIMSQLTASEDLKIQAITARAKDAEKLQYKIEKKLKDGKGYKKLEAIEDLAGVRIIFYLENHKKAFLEMLFREFRPVIKKFEPKYKPNGYKADHFILKLDKKRAALPEYRRFKGLKCELQVTSALYHAWSEIEHDITYKPDGDTDALKQLGLDELSQSFEKVMKDHIQTAAAFFDYASKKYTEIIKAGKILHSGFLQDIAKAKTNDDLADKLAAIKDFYYKKPDETLAMINTILNKKPLPAVVIHKFVDGELYGKTHEDLVLECVKVLRNIRYYKPDEFLALITQLIKNPNKEVSKESNEALQAFVKYDTNLLPKAGYIFQRKALDFMLQWPAKERLQNLEFIKTAARKLLSSSIEGTTYDKLDTLTMHFGAVQPTDFLKKLRRETIDLIYEIYQQATEAKQKLELVSMLAEVTHTPTHVAYKEDISQMIAEDGKYLMEIYNKMLFDEDEKLIAPLAIAEEIDERLHWAAKHNLLNTPEAATLRQKILANPLFSLTRLFAGNDIVFREENGWDEAEQKRTVAITSKIDLVTEDTLPDWIRDLNTIAAEKGLIADWQFMPFRQIFLKKLAETKPDLAGKILNDAFDNNKPLLGFIGNFLTGLRAGKDLALWDKFIKRIVDGKRVDLISDALYSLLPDRNDAAVEFRSQDLTLLENIIDHKDGLEFLNDPENYQLHHAIIQALVYGYPAQPEAIEKLIVKEVAANPKCINIYSQALAFTTFRNTIDFNQWDEQSIEALKNLLVQLPDLDWHSQDLLLGVGRVNIKNIFDVFAGRMEKDEVKKSNRKKIDVADRYDVIPYHMNDSLQSFVATNAQIDQYLQNWLSKVTPQWSSRNWNIGHFIERMGIPLRRLITPLLEAGDDESLQKVIYIISPFDNHIETDLLMEIIGMTDNKNVISHIHSQLFSTGVVSGEYGIAEAYETKAKTLEQYQNSDNPRIKKFAQKIIEDFQKSAIRERQRTDEEKQARQVAFEN